MYYKFTTLCFAKKFTTILFHGWVIIILKIKLLTNEDQVFFMETSEDQVTY